MSKIVSRASLYNSDSESEQESISESENNDLQTYVPPAGFDFIEVDNASSEESENKEKEGSDNEEFDFPLFASAATTKAEKSQDETMEDEERGRSETRVMKVSLREESVEIIKNERPQEYYFAKYTAEEKAQFEAAAIGADDIYASLYTYDATPWKRIDLTEYNNKVEAQNQKEKIRRSLRREGKKKRTNKIECRERRNERARVAKKLERERKNQLMKSYRKFGGGYKKSKVNSGPSKPKYRTE